jgi:hypothetical protein
MSGPDEAEVGASGGWAGRAALAHWCTRLKPVQLLRLSTLQYTSPRAGQSFKVVPRGRRARLTQRIQRSFYIIISLPVSPGNRIREPVQAWAAPAKVTVLRLPRVGYRVDTGVPCTVQALTSAKRHRSP